MKVSGKIADNLRGAITSARRFRGQPVHADTLTHWKELLAYARERQRQRKGERDAEVDGLIAKLQSELAQREQGKQ